VADVNWIGILSILTLLAWPFVLRRLLNPPRTKEHKEYLMRRDAEHRALVARWLAATLNAAPSFYRGPKFFAYPQIASSVTCGRRILLPNNHVAVVQSISTKWSQEEGRTLCVFDYVDEDGERRSISYGPEDQIVAEDRRVTRTPEQIEELHRQMRKIYLAEGSAIAPSLEPPAHDASQQAVIRHQMTEQDILREFPWDVVRGGEKVGQWSGGLVLLRGGVKPGHWIG
jgi:hypothetical protein